MNSFCLSKNMKNKLHVVGLTNSHGLAKGILIAKDLREIYPNSFSDPVVEDMFEFQWMSYIEVAKRVFKGKLWNFSQDCLIICNKEILGNQDNFKEWAHRNFGYNDIRSEDLYIAFAAENYHNHLANTNRKYVEFYISISGIESLGRLVFELFVDIVPRTCENFLSLCLGKSKGMAKNEVETFKPSYVDTIFFRIVPNGFIQGGDTLYGAGNEGYSIFGNFMPDENYILSHDHRGLLSMVNKGRHTGNSQFMVTLGNTTWMDKRYVCFGRLIEGYNFLNTMENITTKNQRPTKEIKIKAISELNPDM